MRYSNNGRVRVEATGVRLGADGDVRLWHGRDKLWPPATPPKIKAVTLDPSVMAGEPTSAADSRAYNFWNFLAAQRCLEDNLGTVTMSGYKVDRIVGYTVYFSNKLDYSTSKFKVGSIGKLNVHIDKSLYESGSLYAGKKLRLETTFPFNSESTIYSAGFGPYLLLNCYGTYTLQFGVVVNGKDIQIRQCSKADTGQGGIGGNFGILRDIQDLAYAKSLSKKFPAPEKFYVVAQLTNTNVADVVVMWHHAYLVWGDGSGLTLEPEGKITKVHVG